MRDKTEYMVVEFSKAILLYGIVALSLIGLGLFSFITLEHEGHWLTGMNNQVVWGLPHVFAIFLIIAASGILNIASISSVFNIKIYKPLGRLSALLAICLLTGGLIVLVLDLGRPDRLVVAMTTFNFKSIFAWNIFLYSGFMAVIAIYLWMMFEARYNKFSRKSWSFRVCLESNLNNWNRINICFFSSKGSIWSIKCTTIYSIIFVNGHCNLL
jgi:molybdopterin-containing oxidoreductase family membrane subunit